MRYRESHFLTAGRADSGKLAAGRLQANRVGYRMLGIDRRGEAE